MITEDYVSFEVAKLLKDNGFDVENEHRMWYVVKQFSTGCSWNSCTYKVGDITREYNDDCCISMPTLQIAMKWLREVHNLTITIIPTSQKELVTGNGLIRQYCLNIYSIQNVVYTLDFITGYEQSCDYAIKYCLENLI